MLCNHPSQSSNYKFPESWRRWDPRSDSLVVQWGNSIIAPRLSDIDPSHFLIVGTAGSGKTGLLKMFMKSVLCTTHEPFRLRFRAVINDPKQEVVSDLIRWGLKEEDIIITNPFDDRRSAWDVASDVNDPSTALQFVRDLKDACRKGESK